MNVQPMHRRAAPWIISPVLALAALSSHAQTAPEGTAAATPTAIAASEDVIQLSPFEIRTDKDQGYTATNAMSGTRINSKIEDLASPISVITKQQLNDTAAVDINDIFLYEANTEGMMQYTEFTIDRNFYNETTTLNPQSANRMRGLGSANNSINGYSSTGVIPIDTYFVDSVEISRGPNANIFGLGNSSGTVNIRGGFASTDRDSAQVLGRVDSYGGWRSSFYANKAVGNVIGVRAGAVHEEKGFIREPSYEKINRAYGALTLRPTRTTTIRGMFETYHNKFRRQNTTLPRDNITEWMANGMPVWDPTFGTTGGWRYLNSSTYTGVATSAESTGLPVGLLPGAVESGIWTNPALAIEPDGRVTFYGMGAASSTTTGPTPAGTPTFRYVQTGSQYRRGATAGGTPLILFQAPSITDQSIYDWEEYNILAPNFGRDKGDTYIVEVEQTLVTNARHRLDAQLGMFREVVDRYDHSVFARSDSGVPFISVDVNEKRLDGSPNPNFLRPYMGAGAPSIRYTDQRNTHLRASLAYQLDLQDEDNWLRWLGRHVMNGYAERRDVLTTSLGARDLNVTDYAWTSANDRGSLPLRGNTYRIYPRYYMGGQVTDAGSIVDYAPAENFSLGSMPLTWYTSGRTKVEEAATIEEIIQSGNSRARRIDSQGIVWQGFFFNDRVVPIVGWRKDRNRERSSRSLNANLNATTTIDPATRLHDLYWVTNFPTEWEEMEGQSRTHGVVVKPFNWLNLNYNQSNSFKPENLAYNINGLLLPNPTGKSKDYGITLKLFNDRLMARVTRYETVEKNSRNGSITSAAVTRTLRMFFDPRSSNAIVGGVPANPTGTLPNGQDAFDLEQASTQWFLWGNPGWTIDQARAAALETYLEPLGFTSDYIDQVRTIGDSNFTDVNTVTSTGTEVELTYNPTNYWTIKVTGAQQKAIDTELGNAVTDFMSSRFEAIKDITVPTNAVTTANGTAGRPWWQISPTNPNATGTATPAGFYVANVRSVIGLATANAGKPRQQTREYRVNVTTDFNLAGITENRWLRRMSVGGSARWASEAAVGYWGAPPTTDPEYRGAIIDYDPNRPIYDDARIEADFWAKYRLRLWNDKVRCTLQLNVRNAFESGRLQAIAFNPDGQAWNYRIVDPRQFILTATFDL